MTPDASKPIAAGPHKLYNHLVVDGGGLVVTAWTVQRNLERPEDRFRGAVYVFLTTLASLSGLVEPGSPIVVCWDGYDNRAWRRGLHPWYKHGRGTVVNREEIRAIIKQVDGLLRAMGIATTKVDGREADDVVASIATDIVSKHPTTEVLMFSDDKDYYQLVQDRVHLARRSMDGIILTERQALVLGLAVGQRYLHIKAMMGDPGDNIKGLKQIGEAKASQAIAANPMLAVQCLADPNTADWSAITGTLRRAFVRAGRLLVHPVPLRDEKFVRRFAKKHGVKVDYDLEVDEERALLAAAHEVKFALGLVTMDLTIAEGIDLKFPKANFEAIPAMIAKLEMGDETDLYSSLYRLAGMTAPGAQPSWRSVVRAGDAISHDAEDKF